MLFDRFWRDVTAFVGWLVLSPASQNGHSQAALGSSRYHITESPSQTPLEDVTITRDNYRSPIFYPPGGDGELKCDYSAMGKDWRLCSIAENRECWIRNIKTGEEFNIHTDYERFAPKGVLREYTLEVTDSWYAADGLNFTAAKLFNDVYPGPWLQACWGDTIKVNVINKMRFNGTSIHWHGIRQHFSMNNDGVNGVTQCPIAPGKHMTYTFDTTQYGSSWYHSHYSVQYADGLQGPITIHGPSSSSYDYPVEPLIMTDWYHKSAFYALVNETNVNKTILLNGRGDVRNFEYANTTEVEPLHHINFQPRQRNTTERAKRYLLRLINTSFDSTFVVSIDNHWMQIVGADFVPLEPYWNTSILVAIGQRYHVIVEAEPDFSFDNGTDDNRMPGDNDGNFWIRTWVADCRTDNLNLTNPGYEQVGIVRYNPESTALPHSKPWPPQFVSRKCSDETYSSLVPKLPWYVGPAANDQFGPAGEQYNVTLYRDRPNVPRPYPLATFSLEANDSSHSSWTPLQVNYTDPTIVHLHQADYKYPPEHVVLNEDYKEGDWVYLAISGDGKGASETTYGAHPIHLHGHDFAILQQEEGFEFSLDVFKPKYDNPPRRDVVLLPVNGFVVIAFRPDNPGNWLLHCHIAEHASFGLGYQLLERRADANHLYPIGGAAQKQTKEVCDAWYDWQKDCKHWWPQDVNETGVFPACHDQKDPPPFFTYGQDSGV